MPRTGGRAGRPRSRPALRCMSDLMNKPAYSHPSLFGPPTPGTKKKMTAAFPAWEAVLSGSAADHGKHKKKDEAACCPKNRGDATKGPPGLAAAEAMQVAVPPPPPSAATGDHTPRPLRQQASGRARPRSPFHVSRHLDYLAHHVDRAGQWAINKASAAHQAAGRAAQVSRSSLRANLTSVANIFPRPLSPSSWRYWRSNLWVATPSWVSKSMQQLRLEQGCQSPTIQGGVDVLRTTLAVFVALVASVAFGVLAVACASAAAPAAATVTAGWSAWPASIQPWPIADSIPAAQWASEKPPPVIAAQPHLGNGGIGRGGRGEGRRGARVVQAPAADDKGEEEASLPLLLLLVRAGQGAVDTMTQMMFTPGKFTNAESAKIAGTAVTTSSATGAAAVASATPPTGAPVDLPCGSERKLRIEHWASGGAYYVQGDVEGNVPPQTRLCLRVMHVDEGGNNATSAAGSACSKVQGGFFGASSRGSRRRRDQDDSTTGSGHDGPGELAGLQRTARFRISGPAQSSLTAQVRDRWRDGD